jgi:hypothetical protein
MDHRDYPQDEQQAGTAGPEPVSPGAASKFPSLIHDYRAQREAWREQARNLARMREEVLAAADHEARGIVSTARADVRRILLKARRDLLVLAAQVRAAGRLGEGEDTIDAPSFLPPDDFGQAHNALTTARHDIRRVLDESRPELEGLASEGEALRAALHHHQPADTRPADVRRHVSRLPVQDIPKDAFAEAPADFDFISIDADDAPELTIRQPRFPIRALVAAAASFGALALMGTGVWMFWPSGKDSSSTETTAAAAPSKPAARDSAPPAVRTPIPEPRSPLSIRLSAKETSWVRVTADGRVTAERIFRPGETENIGAVREVSIRVGDAGAVTVAVDGRQPVALGREGEVVTRRFTVQASRVERTPPAPVAAAPRNPPAPVAQAPTRRPGPASATPAPSAAVAALPPTRVSEQPRLTEQPPIAAAPPPAPAPSANPSASAPLAARPATASVERPPLTPPPASPPSVQDVLTRDASRWLDAYYRQDRATMSSISPQATVSDNRGEKERMPRGLTGVRRTLDEVRFQAAGTEMILTARMTERMDNAAAGQMAQAVSFVSQMWTQRNGAWQLMDVRIMSASAIARSLR